ncbi:conserved hypothetical protein [Cryptococcus deneoformans JEC21]|uniref:Uncharacterized protein n=1 Tax=Cryptococcus deneoformans (strain JEC21 / ATCC MYA-565) TaxID=214684 RepID=Q5KGK3_CRYD1|nr:conserved hypothetical protein [Cryptococcus neoformans var. neoformans JEC21]AAW43585.1 conserved hypothetical protein [Cryptococcus neoformans var. neoformans JEC21]
MAAPKIKPLPPVSVQFLGTSSGGGPIQSRNCSSLAVDFGNEIWLFDAADGTLNRLHQSSLKLANISRIFITHLHVDHVLGLVPVLTTIMNGTMATEEATQKIKELGLKKQPTFHLYGPSGLRNLVRTILNITKANISGAFAIHELLQDGEGPSAGCREDEIHPNEAVGMDMRADEDGVWKMVLQEGNGKSGKGWKVSAGPIHHRVPSLGYVLQEPTPRLPLDTATLIPLLQSNSEALSALNPPVKHPLSLLSHLTSLPPPPPLTLPSGDIISPPEPSGVLPRKIVVFGDCSGGTKNHVFRSMCEDPSLLVHECTNAAIPQAIQREEKGQKARTRDLEPSLMLSRGLSAGQSTCSSGCSSANPPSTPNGFHARNGDKENADEVKRNEVKKKAQSRGHSTPDEVGEFAREIRARRVVINHFSAMFPSPRYPTAAALPSILSSICSFPYPVPRPLPHTSLPPPLPISLTSKYPSELHVRVIMQSLADQILEKCASFSLSDEDLDKPPRGKTGMVIPARDFMCLPIPSHELSALEIEDVRSYKEIADKVTEEWKKHGGIWIKNGEEEWIGVEKEVKKAGWRFKKVVKERDEWVADKAEEDSNGN